MLRSQPQGVDARRHRLLERGCTLGSPDACAELGSSALARGDRAEAERLLVPACEAHVLSACNTLFDDAYLTSDPRADRYHALFCGCPGAQCDDVPPRAPRFEDTP